MYSESDHIRYDAMNHPYPMYHCTVEKPSDTGGLINQLVWLPKQYSKVGERIQLKNKRTGEWEGGWLVTQVGSTQMSDILLAKQNQDIKKAGKGTQNLDGETLLRNRHLRNGYE